MAARPSIKFEFDKDFQWDIIKTILIHKAGYKLLFIVNHDYFDLDYHRVIANAVERFFKRKQKLPATAGLLNEELRVLFKTRDYARNFTEIDRAKITKKVRRLYKSPPSDPEEVFQKCKTFASFIQFKKTLEGIDVNNFTQYETYSTQIQKAVNIGLQLDEKAGSLMVSASRVRLYERHNRAELIPTPYDQLNRLTNAGGYQMGSVFVLIDRPKRGKTFVLINLALEYIKKRTHLTNKAIYFDLENGEDSISTRLDQSLMGLTKFEVISGEHDQKINKAYRSLKRLGCEIYVVRVPNGATTNDLQKILDDLYQSYGLIFNVAFIDYIGLMGALSGKTEDVNKISDAYLDVKNFAKKNNLTHIWTGHHVKREAYQRRSTKYKPDDMAKCIDISRHVDGVFGLQQSEEDIKAGVLRLEVIEQRDGVPFGRVIFKQNLKTQRLKVMSPTAHREYNMSFGELYNEGVEDEEAMKHREMKKKRSSGFRDE